MNTKLAQATARKKAYQQAIAGLDWQDRPDSGGYSINEMRAVFEMVQNPKGWKLPIDTLVELTPVEVSILERAVPHFTGGGVSFTPNRMKGDNWYRVKASGYYANVGA